MKKTPFHLLITLALIAAASSGAARAQTMPDEVPLVSSFAEDALPTERIQVLAQEIMSPEQAAGLRAQGVKLHTMVFAFQKARCYAEVGVAVPARTEKMHRDPPDSAWGFSDGSQSALPATNCEKAMRAALKRLASSEALSAPSLRNTVQRTSDPAKPTFPTAPRKAETVHHVSWGLSERGVQALVDTLGTRWTSPLDHRKFAAYVQLRQDKSVEGRRYCLMLTGLTARPPEGGTHARVPGNLAANYELAGSGDSDCTSSVFQSAMESLRDEYDKQLETFYKLSTEAGQTYPTAAEIRKSIAKAEADERRKAQAPAPTPTRATATSRNVLRCSNDCVNGNCVRTFEDGRKERWQAPRRYNPLTSNWEWDITTNACGG